jgi:hypothetical protein
MRTHGDQEDMDEAELQYRLELKHKKDVDAMYANMSAMMDLLKWGLLYNRNV